MRKPTIAILDGEEALHRALRPLLLRGGYDLVEAADVAALLRLLRVARPRLIILAPPQARGGEWLDVARRIRRWDARVVRVLVAHDSSEDLAIAALREGINDYLKTPISAVELAASVERCLGGPNPEALSSRDGGRLDGDRLMVGESLHIRAIEAYIQKVASTDSNVLITGETGTGKEVVADLIHRNSPRRAKPFVSINCAAIPESLLESELFGYEPGAFTGAHTRNEGKLKLAGGGTAFLDEIGDMSPSAQAKILRAIEAKEVQRLGGRASVPLDLRVIAATNHDIEQSVESGRFRKDLYFRLNVVRIHVPPLRERSEDIPLLIEHYIRVFNRQFGCGVEGFSGDALEHLLQYDWPGNVRELKNLLETIFVGLPPRQIALVDLPEHFHRRLRDVASLPRDERSRLVSALLSTKWNKSRAAQALHWSRMTLYRKIAKYHVVKDRNMAGDGSLKVPATSP